MQRNKPLQVLIIQDDSAFDLLINDPIEKALTKSEIKILGNGEDALSFILKEGEYKDAFSPELVILDLNLPGKMQGFDILKY